MGQEKCTPTEKILATPMRKTVRHCGLQPPKRNDMYMIEVYLQRRVYGRRRCWSLYCNSERVKIHGRAELSESQSHKTWNKTRTINRQNHCHTIMLRQLTQKLFMQHKILYKFRHRRMIERVHLHCSGAADNNGFIATIHGISIAMDKMARSVLIDIHGHNVLGDRYRIYLFCGQSHMQHGFGRSVSCWLRFLCSTCSFKRRRIVQWIAILCPVYVTRLITTTVIRLIIIDTHLKKIKIIIALFTERWRDSVRQSNLKTVS